MNNISACVHGCTTNSEIAPQMAWSSEHKKNTRERIVASAAHLFTTHGFDNIGINEVMENAGLTRGAFYSHFTSKSELYAESILHAGILARQNLLAKTPNTAIQQSETTQLVKQYLSMEHRAGDNARCPLAYLATDISQRDSTVRDTYTRAFKVFVENMKLDDASNSKQEMLRRAVLMIGGLAISRALNDEKLINELFAACQDGVMDNNTP